MSTTESFARSQTPFTLNTFAEDVGVAFVTVTFRVTVELPDESRVAVTTAAVVAPTAAAASSAVTAVRKRMRFSFAGGAGGGACGGGKGEGD
ncbi:MAG TPA: hypothetical protein VFU10_08200 [Gaiellaceae bacterium]|nr:hypothetical protein [Gaiellaceae bacterium]